MYLLPGHPSLHAVGGGYTTAYRDSGEGRDVLSPCAHRVASPCEPGRERDCTDWIWNREPGCGCGMGCAHRPSDRSVLHCTHNAPKPQTKVHSPMRHGAWRASPAPRVEGPQGKGRTQYSARPCQLLSASLVSITHHHVAAERRRAPGMQPSFPSATLASGLRLVISSSLAPDDGCLRGDASA